MAIATWQPCEEEEEEEEEDNYSEAKKRITSWLTIAYPECTGSHLHISMFTSNFPVFTAFNPKLIPTSVYSHNLTPVLRFY